MGKRKSVFLTVAIAAVIVCSLAVFAALRFHGAVRVSAPSEAGIDAGVPIFCQKDERWAEDAMGNTRFTLGSSGCLVCCIASLLSHDGTEITPKELNELFWEEGVYDGEANIIWNNLDKAIGYGALFPEASGETIAECLADGKLPIVYVRVKGIGNFHFVMITGAKDGEYVCMDPLSDKYTTLSDYGNAVYSVRVLEKRERRF